MKKIMIQKITQNNWNFWTVNLIMWATKLLSSRQIFRYAVPARTVTKKHCPSTVIKPAIYNLPSITSSVTVYPAYKTYEMMNAILIRECGVLLNSKNHSKIIVTWTDYWTETRIIRFLLSAFCTSAKWKDCRTGRRSLLRENGSVFCGREKKRRCRQCGDVCRRSAFSRDTHRSRESEQSC